MQHNPETESSGLALELSTVQGSPVHAWAARAIGRVGTLDELRIGRLWLAFGGGWYLLLLMVGLWEISSPFAIQEGVRLPFLRDMNTAFALMVSGPSVAYFLLTDDRLLRRAIRSLEESEVLMLVGDSRRELVRIWNGRFAFANRLAHGLGVAVGIGVAVGNYLAYGDPAAGFWIVIDGRVGLVGWTFALGIGALYSVISIFVLRTFTITWFLRDLVRVARIRVLPFHPDNCGGLKPVGGIALRSQYTLTILGVNLGILVWLTFSYLGATPGVVGLVLLASGAYLVLGPVVFLAPLLPFRQGMLNARSEMLTIVAREASGEVAELRRALDEHRIREYDTGALERLNRVGELISRQPIWPFDVSTLRKFLSAYVVPVVGFGMALAVNMLLETLIKLTIR